MDREAAASRLLGVVHRDVGVHHQLGRGAQHAGLDRRDADAARSPGSRGASSSTTPSCAIVSSRPVATSSAAAASVSGRMIANSSPPRRAMTSVSRRRSRSAVGDAHDQLVAHRVAERVVDVLEVVEVEHQQRRRRCRSARCRRPGGRAPARSARRLKSPVSASWSARCESLASNWRRSVMSWTWAMKYSGSPLSSSRTSERDTVRPHDLAAARRGSASPSRSGRSRRRSARRPARGPRRGRRDA